MLKGMRVLFRAARGWSKRSWLLLTVAVLAIGIGGGAYAALGGPIRPQAAGDIELQRGLVGRWKLDGNTKDATPASRNGVATNASYIADRKGKAAGARSFDGTGNDTVQISPFPSPVLTNNVSTSWSLSVWVKANAGTFNSDNVVLGKQGFNGGITTATGNSFSFGIWNAAQTNPTYILYTPTNAVGVWHQLTATFSNGTMKFYGDGQLVGTESTSAIYTYGNILYIGGTSSGFNFNGAVDDARAYNRELNAAEAKALYESYDPGIQAGTDDNGLIGRWKMDGNTKDATPYAQNATNNGATLTVDRKGAANKAYSFNGVPTTGNYMEIGNFGSTQYNVAVGSARTYSIWLKAGAQPYDAAVFYKNGSCLGWFINLQSNGAISLTLTTGNNGCTGNNAYYAVSTASYADNKWHMVTGVIDRQNQIERLYVDGAQVATQTVDNVYSNNGGVLRIGTDYNNGKPFAGSLDDARIYNRALSATEIKTLYDSYDATLNIQASPTTTTATGNINQGLRSYYPFSGNAKDATPYSNNGSVNGATLTTDRKGRANSAYSFNGTSNYIGLPNGAALTGNSPYTIAAWIKPSSYGTFGIIGWGTYGSNYQVNALRLSSNGLVNYWWNAELLPTVAGLANGQWHHVLAEFDGTTRSIYVDGSSVASDSPGSIHNMSANNVTIGVTNSNEFFSGSIDDVRVYNRALSATEIQTLYTASD